MKMSQTPLMELECALATCRDINYDTYWEAAQDPFIDLSLLYK